LKKRAKAAAGGGNGGGAAAAAAAGSSGKITNIGALLQAVEQFQYDKLDLSRHPDEFNLHRPILIKKLRHTTVHEGTTVNSVTLVFTSLALSKNRDALLKVHGESGVNLQIDGTFSMTESNMVLMPVSGVTKHLARAGTCMDPWTSRLCWY